MKTQELLHNRKITQLELPPSSTMTAKMQRFLTVKSPVIDTPFLIVDLDVVAENYSTYIDAIIKAMNRYFDSDIPMMMFEPGRSLVADAGVIQNEVVLISRKSYMADKRWIFLDIGKFGGLAETIDECIKYRICTPHDGGKSVSQHFEMLRDIRCV